MDGSGQYLLQDAWTGLTPLRKDRLESWPFQSKPPPQQWVIWQSFLKSSFLGRGRKLRAPLGPWINTTPEWEWFYSTVDRNLYQNNLTTWIRYPPTNDRPHHLIFTTEGLATSVHDTLHVPTVYRRGNTWICSGHGAQQPQQMIVFKDFIDYILNSPDYKTCLLHIITNIQ